MDNHIFITINIALTQVKCKSPNCKFNIALLKDKEFYEF